MSIKWIVERIEKNVAWSWQNALFGTVLSLGPAVVIASGNVSHGLPLVVGALPAAVVGLLPTRKQRGKLVFVGALFGIFILLGSFLAGLGWFFATLGMAALAFGAAKLAARKPLGLVVLTLGVPLAGVGLSYSGLDNSISLALLIAGGSVVAYLLSLLFKEYEPAGKPKPKPLMSPKRAQEYGVRLAATAALATSTGFLLGLEHVGWVAGAALFVMRPTEGAQKLRSDGRIMSVFIGALAASWLLSLDLAPILIAVVASIALIAAAATHGSVWYVTPAFSTFLVFWILLYGESTAANIEHRFFERLLETALGVAIAYLCGILGPKLVARSRTS